MSSFQTSVGRAGGIPQSPEYAASYDTEVDLSEGAETEEIPPFGREVVLKLDKVEMDKDAPSPLFRAYFSMRVNSETKHFTAAPPGFEGWVRQFKIRVHETKPKKAKFRIKRFNG